MTENLRDLRRKMNYEAIDAENIRVAKNTMGNLQKQVMLWDRPERKPVMTTEATLTIKSSVDSIIDVLNNKIGAVNKLILERRGDLKDVMNNYDFTNKYNQLIDPLVSSGLSREKKAVIENNLQLIQQPIKELVVLLKKLMDDNEFIDFSRIEGVFTAYSTYKNVENQLQNQTYYKITPERIRSMSADYRRDMNAESIRLLDVAKQQSDLPPNQRIKAYIDEMGPISNGDMAKLKRLYGEPIEKLGKDLEQQFKNTRQMFKDVMRSEGRLNRNQIDDLTNLLETQGTVSQTKMNELIRLYGANSAEMIKEIKESGNLNKTTIEELAKVIADESQSTRETIKEEGNLSREQFKNILEREGGLNRSQITDLTDLLETQGTVSQTKMNELIRLYGANSAELIKEIKESGAITKTSIQELGKKLNEYKLKIGEVKAVRPFLPPMTIDDAKERLDKKMRAGDRDKLLAILMTNPSSFLTGDEESYLSNLLGDAGLEEVYNILGQDSIKLRDFDNLIERSRKSKP